MSDDIKIEASTAKVDERIVNQSVVNATDDDRHLLGNVSSVTRAYVPKNLRDKKIENFEAMP